MSITTAPAPSGALSGSAQEVAANLFVFLVVITSTYVKSWAGFFSLVSAFAMRGIGDFFRVHWSLKTRASQCPLDSKDFYIFLFGCTGWQFNHHTVQEDSLHKQCMVNPSLWMVSYNMPKLPHVCSTLLQYHHSTALVTSIPPGRYCVQFSVRSRYTSYILWTHFVTLMFKKLDLPSTVIACCTLPLSH